eukprot:1727715-Amphidinium_carterae.2
MVVIIDFFVDKAVVNNDSSEFSKTWWVTMYTCGGLPRWRLSFRFWYCGQNCVVPSHGVNWSGCRC